MADNIDNAAVAAHGALEDDLQDVIQPVETPDEIIHEFPATCPAEAVPTTSSPALPTSTLIPPPQQQIQDASLTTQPPPLQAPMTTSAPISTATATAGTDLNNSRAALINAYSSPAYEKPTNTNGTSKLEPKWCFCVPQNVKRKMVGNISCSLGPCTCYTQGSGFLGTSGCCCLWPITVAVGFTWGVLNCLTYGCCGFCG